MRKKKRRRRRWPTASSRMTPISIPPPTSNPSWCRSIPSLSRKEYLPMKVAMEEAMCSTVAALTTRGVMMNTNLSQVLTSLSLIFWRLMVKSSPSLRVYIDWWISMWKDSRNVASPICRSLLDAQAVAIAQSIQPSMWQNTFIPNMVWKFTFVIVNKTSLKFSLAHECTYLCSRSWHSTQASHRHNAKGFSACQWQTSCADSHREAQVYRSHRSGYQCPSLCSADH